MSENKILLDTSALVEYIDRTTKGEEVRKDIEDENTTILVPSVVIAELTSKLKRKKINLDIIERLIAGAHILPLDEVIAKNAGTLHAELKIKIENISLADCVIMTHAENEDAKIISTDHHFKNYKNTKIIE